MKQKAIKCCGVCGLTILAPKFEKKNKVTCNRCNNWLNKAIFRATELPIIASEALRRLNSEIVSYD